MMRLALPLGCLAAATLAVPAGAVQSTAYYEPGMSAGNQRQGPTGIWPDLDNPGRLDWRDIDQAQRWARVGQCVARRDRDGSLAFLSAARRSAQAEAAYRRLDPAFDACFAGSGTVSRGVAEYRRAALADALGKTGRGGSNGS